MNLDIQCEHLSDLQWKELLPQMEQVEVVRSMETRHHGELWAYTVAECTRRRISNCRKQSSLFPGCHPFRWCLGTGGLWRVAWTPRESQAVLSKRFARRLDDCGLTEARSTDLSSALQANLSLTELSLHNSELGDAGVGRVLQALRGPTCKVRKLSLQNCALTAAGCTALLGALHSLPTLLELCLNDNPLGDEGLQLLCEGLRDPQCHLERLQLEYCSLTSASCDLLVAALRARPGLRELVLSNNDLGEAGVQVLSCGLLDTTCPLETLKLASCGVTAGNCKELCSLVATKNSLQELDLGESNLGDMGMTALGPGLLSPSSRLKTLWLWECGISSEGCRDISRVLRAKETLKELSLVGNTLGDQGARLLCEALREPGCRLESLWVRTCGLTDACCPDFSAVLAQNKSLLELQLSANKLGDTGARQLCQGLGQPGAVLQTLCLGDCDVTDRGCSALAALLLSNHSLRELDLSNNCLGDPGVLQLVESLQQPGCVLQQLVLYDIYLSEEVDDRLRALEESKPSLRVIS